MNRILLFNLTVCLASSLLFAQSPVTVNVANLEVDVQTAGTVCVPVSVDTFESIGAVQFDLRWDADLLTLDNVDFGDNPLGISPNEVNQLNDSTWRIGWTVPGIQGITLDYQTELFSLCFSYAQGVEGISPVRFDTDADLLFVFSSPDGIMEVPETANDGSVVLALEISAVVLPTWASEITLFPNPVVGEMINLQGNYPALDGIALYDLNGRMLRAYPPAATQLPLSDLPAGQYVLRFQSGAEQANFKLIKR